MSILRDGQFCSVRGRWCGPTRQSRSYCVSTECRIPAADSPGHDMVDFEQHTTPLANYCPLQDSLSGLAKHNLWALGALENNPWRNNKRLSTGRVYTHILDVPPYFTRGAYHHLTRADKWLRLTLAALELVPNHVKELLGQYRKANPNV